MKNNFSEVEDFCRISNANPLKLTAGEQDYFDKPSVIAASSNFFDFFSYQLLINTPKAVLTSAQDIVISDILAVKYFGDSDPAGQRITLTYRDKQEEMVVSGVFKKPGESTQINFDMVKLIGQIDSRCYLRLAKNTNISQLEGKFAGNKNTIPIVNDGTPGTHYLKDLRAAYFDTSRRQTIEKSRNKSDLYIAIVIAMLIMAVALFNYFGLINNRLMEKNREHVIRRIIGSSKRDLLTDFIIETTILIGLALFLSIFLMIWVMPFFNQLTSSSITLSYIFNLHNISFCC
jgi:putative ABC transport system permease protein